VPETSHPVLLLVCAVLVSLASMTWLALSMQVHAQQVWGTVPSAGTSRVLRGLGAIGIVIALVLCLAVDHATMATLVWVMLATGSALLVAFTLSWQPQRLRLLAPWVR